MHTLPKDIEFIRRERNIGKNPHENGADEAKSRLAFKRIMVKLRQPFVLDDRVLRSTKAKKKNTADVVRTPYRSDRLVDQIQSKV